MSADVEKLWELQNLLNELGDREKRMAVKPEAFAAIDNEYQTASDEMQRAEEALERVSKERRRVDGELADEQELLKKYQGQLMQVKNQQQYAAAWKEIDAARKHVKELEDLAYKSMTEAETLQKQIDDRKTGHDDLQARYDEAHGEWQSSLGDLRGEVEQLRIKIAAVEAALPPRLKDEFYRIFKQRQHVAVAAVASDSCSACRTRIRPALMQQLKRGELGRCEGCHRILYLEKVTS